jgi:hypothetical protein
MVAGGEIAISVENGTGAWWWEGLDLGHFSAFNNLWHLWARTLLCRTVKSNLGAYFILERTLHKHQILTL